MALHHLEVWVNAAKVYDAALTPVPGPRRRATRAPAPPTAIEYDVVVPLEVASDTGIVVLVRGDDPLDDFFGRAMIPPLAFSNPIWVDADGDGVGPWVRADLAIRSQREASAAAAAANAPRPRDAAR